jgi:hypothetical protein
MTQLELLDSARHKLRLAHYHAAALLRVLEQHPTEDLDDCHWLRLLGSINAPCR